MASGAPGGTDPGRPVETALIHDLVPQVDAAYRTIADRTGRVIAGYSMGGSGALRYAMVHPELFGAAIVLSPAVYSPLPPADSSAREFGAYGKGKDPFSATVYRNLNYPAAFGSFASKGLQSHLFIAVGDDEYKNPLPEDYQHDLDFEAHVVFNQAVRVPNLTSEFRVVDGGHDWDVWGPTFVQGAKYIFQFIGKPPATPMKAALSGTAGEDRAGGIAVDQAGNRYEAIAAEGPIDGQPYAGGKDIALTKYGPDGAKLWSREFGTSGTERAYGVALDPQGRPVVTGYGGPGRWPSGQHLRRRLRHPVRRRRHSRVDHAVRHHRRGSQLRRGDGSGRRDLSGRLYEGQPRQYQCGRQGRVPRQARRRGEAGLVTAGRQRR